MASVALRDQAEQRVGDRYFGWIEFTVRAADLTAAATTEALTVAFPATAYPLRAVLNVGEYFAGGSISAMTAQVGDSGDTDALCAALDVFGTTTLGDWTVATDSAEAEYGATGPSLEASYGLQILLTATGDNVDAATAGVVHCRVYYKRYATDEG